MSMFTRVLLTIFVFSLIPLVAGYSVGADEKISRAQRELWMALAGFALIVDLATFSAWALNKLWS